MKKPFFLLVLSIITVACGPENETFQKDMEISELRSKVQSYQAELEHLQKQELEKENLDVEVESTKVKVQGLYEVYQSDASQKYDSTKLLYLVQLKPITTMTTIPLYRGASYGYNKVASDEVAFEVINYNNEGKMWVCEAKGEESLLVVYGLKQDDDMRLGGSVMPLEKDFSKLFVSSTMRDIPNNRLIDDERNVMIKKSEPVKTAEIWIKRD